MNVHEFNSATGNKYAKERLEFLKCPKCNLVLIGIPDCHIAFYDAGNLEKIISYNVPRHVCCPDCQSTWYQSGMKQWALSEATALELKASHWKWPDKEKMMGNKIFPKGQCFITAPRGFFAFEPDYHSERRATLLAILNGFFQKTIVYDSEGHKWRAKGIQSNYKRNGWWVLLANTVYNPVVSVEVLWGEPKRYDLSELKEAYAKAVHKDDDSLTQFVEAKELKVRISEVASFKALVDVYCWMKTDPAEK